jgi:hypothetical protein
MKFEFSTLLILLGTIFCMDSTNPPTIRPLLYFSLLNQDSKIFEFLYIFLSPQDIETIALNTNIIVKPELLENYNKDLSLNNQEVLSRSFSGEQNFIIEGKPYVLIGFETDLRNHKSVLEDNFVNNAIYFLETKLLYKARRPNSTVKTQSLQPSDFNALIVDEEFVQKNPTLNYANVFLNDAVFYSQAFSYRKSNRALICGRPKEVFYGAYTAALSKKIVKKSFGRIVCKQCVKVTNLKTKVTIIAYVTDEYNSESVEIGLSVNAFNFLFSKAAFTLPKVAYEATPCPF